MDSKNTKKGVVPKKSGFVKKFLYAMDYLLHLELETAWSKLRDQNAKLDIVTKSMKEGVILFDKRIEVIFINHAAKKMLRLSEDAGLETVKNRIAEVFKGVDIDKCFGGASVTTPFIIPEIDAGNDIYQLVFSKVDECDGDKCKAFGSIWLEDITESKNLERQKSEFVSVVAHQLRTPLSGLKWTLHMLINGDFGEMANDQKVFVMKSYENNERMISLVNDMLAADRIESGRVKFEQLKINLRDLVENVLFEVMPNAERRKVQVRFDNLSTDNFTVVVDATKIRAVIQNLLENSIKYTMEGGVVAIRIEKLNGEFLVIIKDSGIGIPEKQKPQIFSRFFRASNAIKVETSGTGLGLYMVKKIIEMHKGRVWFESEENKGTTFYFTLPAYKETKTI